MLQPRIIPTLLLQGNRLVKTIRFKEPKYVGDPLNIIRIFNEKEVDELMLLDISCSKETKNPNYKMIEQIASECFMPLTYGGGIRTLDEAQRLFGSGIEKICIQTKALENIKFINLLAEKFGSQSIVFSLDVKRNWYGKPKVFMASKGKTIKIELTDLLIGVVQAGAGEVLLNSVDRDGTLEGPDLDLIRKASDAVNVPIITIGGIASLDDIKASLVAGASAVGAGAFFIYQGPHKAVPVSYPKKTDIEGLYKK
jgi:cyclase